MMNGDDFHDWVRGYRDRVYNFAFYTLRHAEDAEDVTQEVLIRLWHHRAKLDGPTVLAWLLKVTKNACYDTLRRHKSRRKRFEDGHDEQRLESVPSTTPGPHADAEAEDFQKRLEHALRQLPESYRAIVVLREIEGLKYDEIAEVTGRPISSVKIYLHRGRKMLRQHLSRSEMPAAAVTPIEQSPAWPAAPKPATAPDLHGAEQAEQRIAHA